MSSIPPLPIQFTAIRTRTQPVQPPQAAHALCPLPTSAPERGQAMVEFIIALLVLLPLLLIIPLLGKYLDLAHVTTLASRFALFELSVRHGSSAHGWASTDKLSAQVRKRFYQLPTEAAAIGSANPLWYDHRSNALIDGEAEHVEVELSSFAGPNAGHTHFADDFGLATEQIQRANVSLVLKDTLQWPPFDTLGLTIQRDHAMLVDSWAAASSSAIKQRLQRRPDKLNGPFPYQPLASLLSPLRPFVSMLEGASLPDAGAVNPDQVPEDRIR